MDKFNEYNLNLSEKQKDLAQNYLERIKSFVDNYSLDGLKNEVDFL